LSVSERRIGREQKGRHPQMAQGLPARATLLAYEEIVKAERMVLDGRPHREMLPVLTEARRLARRADNGVAGGMVDARTGLTDDELMERRLNRDARRKREARRVELVGAAD
jgi:hypothetical protein